MPHRARVLAALPAMVLYALASGGLAYLIQPILDEVLPQGDRVGLICGAIVGLFLAKGVGSYFSVYLMADASQRLVRDLRTELFAHILGQSTAFFGGRATGRLLSRLTNDVSRVQQVVSETCGDLLRESFALIAFAALLLYRDVGLALVCMTGAPLVVYPLVRLGQRVRRTTRRSQELLEHLSHLTVEAFTGHRIVQAFQAEAFERRKFHRASERLYRTNMKVTSTMSVLPPLMEVLGGLGIAGVLWYGSRQIAAADLSAGEFVSFLMALLLMYGPVKKLSRVNANIQQALAAAERIFETLDTHTETADRQGARVLAPLGTGIEFRDVTFQYHDDAEPVLRGISFTVQAGQVAAVVGLSGAGKTTLVNLVPRFHDVTGGAILIDGVDLRDVTLRSLRGTIGMVTQDTILFDASIADNIAYADQAASRESIEAVARAAHAHEFIVELPQGYDADRRARPAVVRRPAAAADHRPSAAEEFADPDPRRGDLGARCGVGAAGTGCPAEVVAQPDGVRHRAPTVDDPPGGRDHRPGRGAGGRGRAARRVTGEAGQHLRAALRESGLRERDGSRGDTGG